MAKMKLAMAKILWKCQLWLQIRSRPRRQILMCMCELQFVKEFRGGRDGADASAALGALGICVLYTLRRTAVFLFWVAVSFGAKSRIVAPTRGVSRKIACTS